MRVIEKALGGRSARARVLPYGFRDRGQDRGCAAPRHGRAARVGALRAWDDGEAIHEALVAAGEGLGLRLVGDAVLVEYARVRLIPSPLPAVYSGESMKAYRDWLPANGYEGSACSAASFVSDEIEDYYHPRDLGYGSYVVFDHDFVGREALAQMAGGDHRRKVTLALDDEDVTRTIGTMFESDEGEVHGLAVGGVLDAPVRPGHGRRKRDRRSAPGSATARTSARC